MRFNSLKILLLILVPVLIIGQNNYQRELSRNRIQLDDLKKEIEDISNKLASAQKTESSVMDQLKLIDRETALIARSKGLLEQENRILRQKIKYASIQLQEARKRCQKLKELYGKRAVYTYKYGRIRELELLLTASSFNQAFIRYRYLQKIAEHDERTIQSIHRKKTEIEQLTTSLTTDLKGKRENLVKKRRQEQKYLDRRKEKNALLKKVRFNQESYDKQLAVKQSQKENLIQMILELERKRQLSLKTEKRLDEIAFSFDDFGKAQGKLPWPVKGKVVTRYGKQRDKKSKTYIKNTDIEIESKLGTSVRCVFKGVVRVITYMPGYGNTVIVDHGKGYYSVYSHLDEIYVMQDQGIDTNQVIATVGDSGSLAGAKLQFGIYGKQKTYDPEKWLR